MKLIKPKYEFIEQEAGENGIYKMIELAGRTCYKSEDKITPDSAKGFVERMIKSGHGAMLEHGTVYLKRDLYLGHYQDTKEYHEKIEDIRWFWDKYRQNKYSIDKMTSDKHYVCITTNLRVLIENEWLDDLKYLCEPTEYHERRVTVKFICDRVTGESFLRHRVFSFARESTRYCNYSKDKFNSELTFIIPNWVEDVPDNTELSDTKAVTDFVWKPNGDDLERVVSKFTQTFLYSCIRNETDYLGLVNGGYKAQQARDILSFSIKSPLVMTGFVSDWEHFFELRDDARAHPQAQELAKPLHEDFIKKGYIHEEHLVA